MKAFYPEENEFEMWDFPPLENELNIVAKPIDASIYEPQHPLVPKEVEHIVEEPSESVTNSLKIQEKLHWLDDIGYQMQAIVSEVDASFLNSVMNLIKLMVKKIILKEMTLDQSLLKDMILNALNDIKKENDSCVVHVSMDDIALFDAYPMANYIELRIDPHLQPGDFVIKSKTTELVAILEKRLTTLFGF